VGVDVVLVAGLAAFLLVVAVGVVRRHRSDCVWPIVGAAVIVLVGVTLNQVVAPIALRLLEDRIAANLSIALLIPAVVSLVADVLQAAALGLLVLAVVGWRAGRG
jgi:hypothetical protein